MNTHTTALACNAMQLLRVESDMSHSFMLRRLSLSFLDAFIVPLNEGNDEAHISMSSSKNGKAFSHINYDFITSFDGFFSKNTAASRNAWIFFNSSFSNAHTRENYDNLFLFH